MKTPTEDTPVSERKWTKGPVAVLVALDKHIKAERALGYEASAIEGDEARSIVIELYEALAELVADAGWAHMTDDQLKDEAELGNEMVLASIKARAALQRAEGEV